MPRVDYQLSFENYLEMNAGRTESPSNRVPLIAALLGLALMLGGYLYLRVPPPDECSFPGGLLLGSGLLSEIVAVVLGLLNARPKSKKPSINMLRREYETYAADKREIEFDEHSWRVRWYEGDDVRPWTALRAVHDLKSLVVLSTTGTHYWIPKQALEVDELGAQLNSLATSVLESRTILATVPVKPSAATWVFANALHTWRRNLLTNLIVGAAFILVSYWALLSDWAGLSVHSNILIAVVPFLFLVCQSLYYLQTYYFAKWEKSPEEARIMEDCISYKTATVNWIIEFRTLVEWREISSAFLLYFQVNQFHFVPKRGFSVSQIEQFRRLLAANCPRAGH